MRCKVCNHPKRNEIERAIARKGRDRLSDRAIAEKFGGLSRSSIRRHRLEHMPELTTPGARPSSPAAVEMRESSALDRISTEQLLDDLQKTIALAKLIFKQAFEKEEKTATEARVCLAALREMRESMALLLRSSGNLPGDTQVSVFVNSPQWAQLRTAIMDALAPYPKARIAVSDAIQIEVH